MVDFKCARCTVHSASLEGALLWIDESPEKPNDGVERWQG